MTKCGNYKDPDYIEKYRKNNRDKFNRYTQNWIERKKLEDPDFTKKQNEKMRKYYAENKEWIIKRNKLKRQGVDVPDLRRLKKEQPDEIKNLSKKGVDENKPIDVKPILNVNNGEFFIDWSV